MPSERIVAARYRVLVLGWELVGTGAAIAGVLRFALLSSTRSLHITDMMTVTSGGACEFCSKGTGNHLLEGQRKP
jgi:hypothetical protein